MSIRLYIGNLPKDIERQELESVFAEFDSAVTTKVITDRKTEQANQIIEKFDGYMLNDTPLKIEVAQPRAKGKEDGEAAEADPGANKRSKANSKPASRKPAATESEAVQPDPRWAQDLEKLKQLLAAQTASS